MLQFTQVGTDESLSTTPFPSSVSLYTKLGLYGRGETSVTMV